MILLQGVLQTRIAATHVDDPGGEYQVTDRPATAPTWASPPETVKVRSCPRVRIIGSTPGRPTPSLTCTRPFRLPGVSQGLSRNLPAPSGEQIPVIMRTFRWQAIDPGDFLSAGRPISHCLLVFLNLKGIMPRGRMEQFHAASVVNTRPSTVFFPHLPGENQKARYLHVS